MDSKPIVDPGETWLCTLNGDANDPDIHIQIGQYGLPLLVQSRPSGAVSAIGPHRFFAYQGPPAPFSTTDVKITQANEKIQIDALQVVAAGAPTSVKVTLEIDPTLPPPGSGSSLGLPVSGLAVASRPPNSGYGPFKVFGDVKILVVKVPVADPRPESVRPVTDSLQLGRRLGASAGWSRRRALVEPLVRGSMCDVLQQQHNDRTSLTAIRPGTVEDLIIDKEASDWAPNQLAVIGQGGLFDAPKSPLKKIPYRFRYRYRCANRSCPGHTQSIIDWELGQAYLSWKATEEERLRKIREKWLGELCGPSKDTIFFVGNIHLHPRN